MNIYVDYPLSKSLRLEVILIPEYFTIDEILGVELMYKHEITLFHLYFSQYILNIYPRLSSELSDHNSTEYYQHSGWNVFKLRAQHSWRAGSLHKVTQQWEAMAACCLCFWGLCIDWKVSVHPLCFISRWALKSKVTEGQRRSFL